MSNCIGFVGATRDVSSVKLGYTKPVFSTVRLCPSTKINAYACVLADLVASYKLNKALIYLLSSTSL